MIEFVKPTHELVVSIAKDMRPSDKAEVWASNHFTPLEALEEGWSVSDFSTIAMCDNEPLVMMGLAKRDILSGGGVIWMLGANKSMKYKKEFVRQTKPLIDEMLSICPHLWNMVHDKNRSSIAWLRWLGFTIEDPIPYGPDGELFHRFYIERLN